MMKQFGCTDDNGGRQIINEEETKLGASCKIWELVELTQF